MDPIQAFTQSQGYSSGAPLALYRPDQHPAKAPAAPGFFGAVGGELGNIAGGIGNFVGHAITDGPIQAGQHLFAGLASGGQANSLAQQQQMLSQKGDLYFKQMKSGQISRARYSSLTKDLFNQHQDLNNRTAQMQKDIGTLGERVKAGVETAVDVASVAAPELKGLQAAAKAGGVGGRAAKILAGEIGAKPVANTAGGAVRYLAGKAARTSIMTPFAGQIAQDASTGNVGDLAVNAGLIGGSAAVIKAAGKLAPFVKNLLVDKSGLVDHIQIGGNQTLGDWYRNMAQGVQAGKVSAAKFKAVTNSLKVLQDQATQEHGANPKTAAMAIMNHQEEVGRSLTNMSGDQVVKEVRDLQASRRLVQGQADNLRVPDMSAPSGSRELTAAEKARVGVIRITQEAKSAAARAIGAASSKDEAMQAANQIENKNVREYVTQVINRHDDMQAAAKELRSSKIVRGNNPLIKLGEPLKLKNGYLPALLPESAGQIRRANQVEDLVTGNKARLGGVTRVLGKVGLSPLASEPKMGQEAARQNFVKQIAQNEKLAGMGNRLWTELNNMARLSKTAQDVRFLPKNDAAFNHLTIKQALRNLKMDESLSGDVRKALDKAYRQIPLGQRAIGSKVVDQFIRIPGARNYLQVQNLARFTLNPFFHYIKVPVKSAYIAAMEGNGGRIMGFGVKPEVSKFVQGVAEGSVKGNADFLGGDLPRLAKGFTGKLQSNLAGNLVQNILGGVKIEEASPELKARAEAAVQMIYGYPKSGYLASDLSRTLNVILFPSRFETKIGMATAKFLAHQSPVMRGVLVGHMAQGINFLNSPDGQKWQHDNSKLYSLIKYFSPMQTFDEVAKALGGDHQVGDFGEIGGLPFGLAAVILKGQGVNLGPLASSPYAPQGIPIPQKVPVTDMARAYQGLTDFISTMFSWPGAEVGLQSKTKDIQQAVGAVGLPKPAASEFQSAGGTGGGQAPAKPLPAIKPTGIKNVNMIQTDASRPLVPRASAGAKRAPKAKRSKVIPAAYRLPSLS